MFSPLEPDINSIRLPTGSKTSPIRMTLNEQLLRCVLERGSGFGLLQQRLEQTEPNL